MDPKNTHCSWCSASNCRSSRNKRPGLPFFRFPSDPNRCKKWVINSGRADLHEKSAKELHKSYYLCGDHFEISLFSKNASKRNILVKDAVPTIFRSLRSNVRRYPRLPPKQPSNESVARNAHQCQRAITNGGSGRVDLDKPGPSRHGTCRVGSQSRSKKAQKKKGAQPSTVTTSNPPIKFQFPCLLSRLTSTSVKDVDQGHNVNNSSTCSVESVECSYSPSFTGELNPFRQDPYHSNSKCLSKKGSKRKRLAKGFVPATRIVTTVNPPINSCLPDVAPEGSLDLSVVEHADHRNDSDSSTCSVDSETMDKHLALPSFTEEPYPLTEDAETKSIKKELCPSCVFRHRKRMKFEDSDCCTREEMSDSEASPQILDKRHDLLKSYEFLSRFLFPEPLSMAMTQLRMNNLPKRGRRWSF